MKATDTRALPVEVKVPQTRMAQTFELSSEEVIEALVEYIHRRTPQLPASDTDFCSVKQEDNGLAIVRLVSKELAPAKHFTPPGAAR